MERKAWLEERRHGIGGSDAAAIIGLNPYVTPYMLWADKTGKLPEQEDSEATRQGRDLEEYVARRFVETTGKKVRKNNRILRNPNFPFAHANIDREVIGERAGLECKTTSVLNLKKFRNGEYPAQYYVQCVHYMAVTGYLKWYLAVLILNRDFLIFEIERDEDEIQALMKSEWEFWEQAVVADKPPEADGRPPTSDAMDRLFPGGQPGMVSLTCDAALSQYLLLAEQIKAMERQKEVFAQKIKQELCDFEEGVCGKYSVNWKTTQRRNFDYTKFRRDNPDLDVEPYFKISTFRRFSVKEDN